MPDEPLLVIEIVGEGKTDRGQGGTSAEAPTTGIIPILTHALCGQPEAMRVKRRRLDQLQGKGLWQKVRFAKQQAKFNGSDGLVFVLDTEGSHPSVLAELQKGRDHAHLDFAAAVGVAHPCIEAWLLADGAAIRKGLGLPREPDLPSDPESLPAPQKDRIRNPKTILANCGGSAQPLSAAETTKIAAAIRDLDVLRTRCPASFAPFAEEVEGSIKPLF